MSGAAADDDAPVPLAIYWRHAQGARCVMSGDTSGARFAHVDRRTSCYTKADDILEQLVQFRDAVRSAALALGSERPGLLERTLLRECARYQINNGALVVHQQDA